MTSEEIVTKLMEIAKASNTNFEVLYQVFQMGWEEGITEFKQTLTEY